jgi:hypothetical protein
MVISFFLCLGGYGQAAQVMDRVSLSVQNVEVVGDVSYDEEAMSELMGQTIYLFSVIYDNESTESHRWNNDTGKLEYIFYPDYSYMTFLSDASYLTGDDLLSILNIFNYVPPLYPNVRQVYNDTNYDGYPYVTPENPGTTYDYQIEEGVCGCLFNYYSNYDSASGHIDFTYGEGRSASVQFWGDYTVERIIFEDNEEAIVELVEEDIAKLQEDGTLTEDQADGLLAKLTVINNSLDRGNTRATCNQLRAFIQQILAFINSGDLTELEGSYFIEIAENIQSQIGCQQIR